VQWDRKRFQSTYRRIGSKGHNAAAKAIARHTPHNFMEDTLGTSQLAQLINNKQNVWDCRPRR